MSMSEQESNRTTESELHAAPPFTDGFMDDVDRGLDALYTRSEAQTQDEAVAAPSSLTTDGFMTDLDRRLNDLYTRSEEQTHEEAATHGSAHMDAAVEDPSLHRDTGLGSGMECS